MADPAATPAQDAGVKGDVRLQEPTRSERALARRSAESRATVPDIELSCEVALAPGRAWSESLPTPDLLRACAAALREVPRANGAYRDGRFELFSRVNIGVTLALGQVYAVPTLFDCDRRAIEELTEELSRLRERARAGALSSPELTGATFTVFNVGELGISNSTPMIVPPQAAALSAGAVREVAVAHDGAIVPGRTMTLTLACDHRILYGAPAAAFLAKIKSQLEGGSS